jgi:2-phospho-L-lactate/phosphoenolpyruvate guanylyltransferase
VSLIGAVPIKPFQAAKRRLQEVLSPALRASISRQLAANTVGAIQSAGATPLILAADDEVADWGKNLGLAVILDEKSDLNAAAALAVAEATRQGLPWLVLHVDLPLLTPEVLRPAISLISNHRPVIAASSDGGTPLIGTDSAEFDFAYGPGSFQRHLRLLANEAPVVIVDARVAIDLDGPDDLRALSRRVRWLAEMTDTLPPS